MFLENESEGAGRVGETRVKAEERRSLHRDARPLGGDKQLMGSRWGADEES